MLNVLLFMLSINKFKNNKIIMYYTLIQNENKNKKIKYENHNLFSSF